MNFNINYYQNKIMSESQKEKIFLKQDIEYFKKEHVKDKNVSKQNFKSLDERNSTRKSENSTKHNSIGRKIESYKKILIKYILILYLVNAICANIRLVPAILHSSKINVKIKGIGNGCIYYKDFVKKPDEININGEKQVYIKNEYYLNQSENYVELIWDTPLTNCSQMFKECSKILEIDLSNFDSSNVKTIESMFYECSSLTSINLTNFDTSNVSDMNQLFYSCISLNSIDLSSFITSKVNYMYSMFQNCSSLTSLNLSNFNTSNVKYTLNQ